MEKTSLKQQSNKLRSLLAQLPEGELSYVKNGPYFRWFRKTAGARSPISKKETAMAEKLAMKKHLTDALRVIESRICQIDMFLRDYNELPCFPDSLSDPCPDHRKLLTPYFEQLEKERAKWMTEDYPRLMDHPEQRNVPTKASIMVRSKSEAIIANELYDNGILFQYEPEVNLGTGVFYPDFLIAAYLLPSRGLFTFPVGSGNRLDPSDIIILEHFGMMDDRRYFNNVMYKISAYLEAGFIPGKNFFFTFESKQAPLDSKMVTFLISYFFT